MKKTIYIILIIFLFSSTSFANPSYQSPLIIDHNCTDISKIPADWITKAKEKFRIWYGHTSHGSQITSGIKAITNPLYRGLSYVEVYGDLGHEGNLDWMHETRKQLKQSGNDRNLVMWSWCGGCSDNNTAGINKYLNAMDELEKEFPNVTFIYMTGHLDGTGVDGTLNKMNNQIREFCKTHNKILFDFADIESFDPDGNGYLEKKADDGCYYDADGDGEVDKSWAEDWMTKHPQMSIDLPKEAAHTHPLNGALKGRAFWWMLARLAGWDGE